MAGKTDRIRDHHKEILGSIGKLVTHARSLTGDSDASLKAELSGDVRFLREDLVPHAEGEERTLYPAVDEILRKHGRPTATMIREHAYLRREIDMFCRLAERIASRGEPVPDGTREALLRTAIRLEFLLSVHLEAEEEDYFPLIEEHMSREEVDSLIKGMHKAA